MMRYLIVAATAALLATPALADPTGPFPSGNFASPQEHMKACSTMWDGMAADTKKLTTHQAYMSACLKSKGTSSLAAPTSQTGLGAPAGATGMCKDGTYTMSKTHTGACSRHGGVAKWL